MASQFGCEDQYLRNHFEEEIMEPPNETHKSRRICKMGWGGGTSPPRYFPLELAAKQSLGKCFCQLFLLAPTGVPRSHLGATNRDPGFPGRDNPQPQCNLPGPAGDARPESGPALPWLTPTSTPGPFSTSAPGTATRRAALLWACGDRSKPRGRNGGPEALSGRW